MHITLVRHGETLENANRIVQGQLDGTLSQRGIDQALEVAQVLKNTELDYSYCSDLGRCRDTAKYILSLQTDLNIAELREVNFGDFQGKSTNEVNWNALNGGFGDRKPPNGESGFDMRYRVVSFINHLLNKHRDDKLLIITHGGPMKALKSVIENQDYEETVNSFLDNCEVWEYNILKPLHNDN